jgi:hypothetical protein
MRTLKALDLSSCEAVSETSMNDHQPKSDEEALLS